MPSPHLAAPPQWDVNPSARSQRAPLVALSLVGLALSIATTLHARGVLEVFWEPFPVVTADGWIRRSLAVPLPELDIIGFGAVLVTSLLGRKDRWRTVPSLAVATGIAVAFTAVSAVARWTTQYAATGRSSTLFFLLTGCAIALMPLVADEVYSAVLVPEGTSARGRLQTRVMGGRVTDALGYVSGTGAIIVGLWLLGAPLPASATATVHAHIAGGVIVAVGALSLAKVARPTRWVNAAIGAALLVAPLAYGYSLHGAIHIVVAGLLLLVVSSAFDDPREPRSRTSSRAPILG